MARKLLVWTIKNITDAIDRATSKEMKFDFNIFIEGKRGTGKSTLGYKVGSRCHVEQPFSPRRDLVYSREDTIKHLSNKINGVIFSDELINVAYKRDFYVEDQKELLKAFDMYRDSRNVFIGCIPMFLDLDVKIQKICKLRLSVIRRGFALVHMPISAMYSSDPWDIKNNAKIESKWALNGTKNPRYSQLTTCVGVLYFGDLTPGQRKEYDEIKDEKRSHVFAKYAQHELSVDPETKFYNNLIAMLKSNKLTPDKLEMVCKINDRSYGAVRNKINVMLKEEGQGKTFKDYCLSDTRRKRLDKLGFAVEIPDNEEAIQDTPEPIQEAKPIQILQHRDSKIDIPVSEPVQDEADLLGFDT